MAERRLSERPLPGAVCNCEKQNPRIVWARDIRMCDCMVRRSDAMNRRLDNDPRVIWFLIVLAGGAVAMAVAGLGKMWGWW